MKREKHNYRTVWKTTFIVSSSKFARTNPIYHLLVLLKIDREVDARRRCIRALNVGWINMPQNYVQTLYFHNFTSSSSSRESWWVYNKILRFVMFCYVAYKLFVKSHACAWQRCSGCCCLTYSTTLKPGFHYPSWRPELTTRVDGRAVSTSRAMETGL